MGGFCWGSGHGKPSPNEHGRDAKTKMPRGFEIMQPGVKAFALLSLLVTDVGVQVWHGVGSTNGSPARRLRPCRPWRGSPEWCFHAFSRIVQDMAEGKTNSLPASDG